MIQPTEIFSVWNELRQGRDKIAQWSQAGRQLDGFWSQDEWDGGFGTARALFPISTFSDQSLWRKFKAFGKWHFVPISRSCVLSRWFSNCFCKKPKNKGWRSISGGFPINRDGSGEKQLTHFPKDDPAAKGFGYKAGALKWHPTENFISYASSRGDHTFIFGINPDGSNSRQISQSGKDEVYHDWSPDGKWLVFDQYQDTVSSQYHIVLLNWQTKESRVLSDTLIKSQLAPVFVKKELAEIK